MPERNAPLSVALPEHDHHASCASSDETAQQRIVITIDGPAGTGKSTMAQQLARRLGIDFLDTGAMYRAAAVIAMDRGLSLDDGPAVAQAIDQAHLAFDFSQSPPVLCIHHPHRFDMTDRLRSPEATTGASKVGACPEVRAMLVQQQRRIGSEHPCLVSEGRDQGSVVFPDADVKFYLDATPMARARRRAQQLRAESRHADEEVLRAEIEQRDLADSTRKVGPLVVPHGAIVVDTTDLSQDEVLDLLTDHVRSKLPPLGPR